MSIIKTSKFGYFISHKKLVDEIYKNVNKSETNFELNPELFNIFQPYKQPKTKHEVKKRDDPFVDEVQHVKELYELFHGELREFFDESTSEVRSNAAAFAETVYAESGKFQVGDLHGANPDGPISKTLKNATFLFPEKCKFYGKNVSKLSEYLDEKYDLVVLDPPWWNKYIRRKRKRTEHGYEMMYNQDLKKIPLENFLKNDALVVVWCTNSNQHFNDLCNDIFPKWGVEYLGKWYWVKITQLGAPICEFAQPPRKQPFEQIIFACRNKNSRKFQIPTFDKIVVSVPSALHSHKPPLIKVLAEFLPETPKCLEIFARYLMPDWTSFGNEVLRFQHESLYRINSS